MREGCLLLLGFVGRVSGKIKAPSWAGLMYAYHQHCFLDNFTEAIIREPQLK